MTLYIRRSSGVTVATIPSAPAAPELVAGNTQLGGSFLPPTNDGGSAVLSYDLRHSVASADSWTEVLGVTSPFTIASLSNGTSYDVQIRAVNAQGNGIWSASATATPAATGTLDYRSSSLSSDPYGTAMAVPAGAVAGNTLIFIASFGSDVSTDTTFAPALSSTIPGMGTAGLADGITDWRGWWIPSWDGTTTSYNFGDEGWAGERVIVALNGTASDVVGGSLRTLSGGGLAWTGFAMTEDDVIIALAGTYNPADSPITSFDSSFTKFKDQGATEWCGLTAWYKRLTATGTVNPSPAGTSGAAGVSSTQLIRVRP